MLIQLTEPIECSTPLGRGWALFLESTTADNFWTVALNSNGALITLRQKYVKATRNFTLGRNFPVSEMRKIIDSDEAKE
jgi:hypothetical protein